eukprot:COSAG06_NODE_30891_length_530_cov_1.252900_1_plen_67_part_00
MEALGRKRVAAPGVANDHYASNPVAFNAVALMQHRIQAMGAAAPRAVALDSLLAKLASRIHLAHAL